MGLTFWAELYFRSLKTTKVLSLFTKYLVQYGRVCIPHIGTFELETQPPRHDIADKRFMPPTFVTRYSRLEKLSAHQSSYFAFSNHSSREKMEDEIASFGAQLKNKIRQAPFQWNGLGTLRLQSSEILFEPAGIKLSSLNPVPAHKVIRENVQHQVLVGDHQMTSQQVSDSIQKPLEKYPLYMRAGWIILALAVITIIVLLYLGKFQVSSSGLKWSAAIFSRI